MQDTHLLISQTLKLWLTPTIFLLLSFRAHRHQYIALIYVFFFLLRRFKSMCLTNTFVMEMDNELSQRGQSNLLFSKNEKLWKDVKGNWLIVQKKKRIRIPSSRKVLVFFFDRRSDLFWQLPHWIWFSPNKKSLLWALWESEGKKRQTEKRARRDKKKNEEEQLKKKEKKDGKLRTQK